MQNNVKDFLRSYNAQNNLSFSGGSENRLLTCSW
jgi:hypothetical protein